MLQQASWSDPVECRSRRAGSLSASPLKSTVHESCVCVSAIVRGSNDRLLHGVKHFPFVKVRKLDFELLLS